MFLNFRKKYFFAFLKWFLIYFFIYTFLFILQWGTQKLELTPLILQSYFMQLFNFEVIALLCTYTGIRAGEHFQDMPYVKMFLMILPYVLMTSVFGLLVVGLMDALLFPSIVTLEQSLTNVLNSFIYTPVITVALSLIFSRLGYLEYKIKTGAMLRVKEEDVIFPDFQETKNNHNGLSFKENENYFIVPYDDIIYISAHNKSSVIHTHERDFKTAKLLKEIEQKLPLDRFFRIHKSFIVKLSIISHIQYFMGGSYLAFLKDEDETNLPVGRTYAPLLKAKLNL